MKSNLHPFGRLARNEYSKRTLRCRCSVGCLPVPLTTGPKNILPAQRCLKHRCGLGQAPEAIFRFVLNDDGFDVGYDAVGMDLCCFSIPLSAMPTVNLDEEETLSRLTGEVIHGVLLSLPEYLEMPDRLVYQLNDEVMAFNSCGNGILHGWTSAQELWRNEILPRTPILMQHTSVIH